ncbi:MAG: hypothetical protein H8E87_01260, partial [FCB group bacterium]|nr:hypothetical protein [FCB group bacterium]
MELQRINLQDRLEKLSKVSGLEDVTAAGNLGLLDEPKAAVFNSRQGKTLISDSPWVENTINLCLKMVESSVAIVSSIGMTTWEIVTWKTGVSGGKLILLIPDTAVDLIKTISENIIVDFNLDPDKTLLLFPHPDAEPNEKYKRLPKRDFWIAALADRIYPVSVRSGGNMSRLVELYSIL